MGAGAALEDPQLCSHEMLTFHRVNDSQVLENEKNDNTGEGGVFDKLDNRVKL
jgi:hypothetical protein